MNFRELINMVLHNLLRMKVRVGMTAAGVVIGTAAVVLLVSLGIALQESAVRSFGNIGEFTELTLYPKPDFGTGAPTAGPPRPAGFKQKELDVLKALEGVSAVVPLFGLGGELRMQVDKLEGWPGMTIGVEPGLMSKLSYNLGSGNLRLGPGQIIVGGGINYNFYDPNARPTGPQFNPEKLNLQGKTLNVILTKYDDVGQPIRQQYRFTVAGVLERTGGQRDSQIYLPLRDAIEMTTWLSGQRPNVQRDGYQQLVMRVNTPEDAQRIERYLSEQGYQVQSPFAILRQITGFFRIFQAVLGGIGGVALLVAAFGIANTMIMAIYERSREIGLMKAVGATNRDVMFIFLGEAGAIGFIGGVIGCALALALGQVIGALIANAAAGGGGALPPNMTVNTPPWLIVGAIGFSIVVGVLSGLYPALRTTRLDPIAALRTE
jgi:putative ABC transport system permease protein